MNNSTATITFHSSDFFLFESLEAQNSKHDQVEYSESDNLYSFRVPVLVNDSGGRSIQDTLEHYAINLARPAVPLVNGKPQGMDYVLKPGDCVIMLFQISGG